jgi:T5SS/PEP-CTERM-associated repeat protein
MRTHFVRATATAAALLAATSSTRAQTNWTGTVSSDWFTALNWNAGVPTAGTNANIDTVLPNPTVVAAPGGTALTLAVGQSGTGMLTIQNGGTVSNVLGTVGNLAGGLGTVTVTGAGSTWTNTASVVVGGLGTGTLTIQNSGMMNSAGGGSVGQSAGSTGTVTVTGAGSSWINSPGGGLNIAGFGTGTLTIANGGIVINNTAFTANIGSGAGSQGTVTVTGAGSIWSNNSGVIIGNSGTGTLTIADGGMVTDTTGAVGGAPGSQGVVTVTGAGSTWTNTATLLVGGNANGTLTIAAGGTVTSVGGAIGIGGAGFGSQGAVLITGPGSSWSSSPGIEVGTLGGTGALTIADDGVASGPIFIASTAGSIGTVNIGAAAGSAAVAPGTLNSASVAFGAGTGTLNFNHTSTNYVFAPTISGNGTVNVLAGTTTLTGANTYTGPTNVNSRALIVDGSIASSSLTTVNSGAALLGGGTVGSTVVNAGGFLVPGPVGVPGAMTVSGNLVFQSGAFYVVQVNSTTASTTNVSGTASLAGTVAAIFAPGSYLSRSYTILTAAGGRTGTFDALTTFGLPAGFGTRVNYTGNTAVLNLKAQLVPGPEPPTPTPPTLPTIPPTPVPPVPGLPPLSEQQPPPPLWPFTQNEINVGRAIDNFFNNGGTLPPAFGSLYFLTGGTLANALTQLSGEVATGAALSATQMMNLFLSLTLNPYGGSPTGNPGALGYARAFGANEANAMPKQAADAYAANMPVKAAPPAGIAVPDGSWSVWGQGYGGHNKTDGNLVVGSHDTTARTYGFAAGADYRLSPATTVGVALAGGELDWSLSQRLGSGKSDVFQAGVYGSHRIGAAYVSAALAYAWYNMSTDRTVTAAGNDVLRASFDAHNIGGRVEGGYRFAMSSWGGVTPYGAVQVQRFRTPNYSEVAGFGNNTFALSYNSNSTTASRLELGSWFDHLFAFNNGNIIMFRGRLAWAHDDGNNSSIGAVFQTLPGADFTVNGATPPRNLALASVGAELRLVNNVSIGARFDGEFSDRAQTYSGTGTVRYRW